MKSKTSQCITKIAVRLSVPLLGYTLLPEGQYPIEADHIRYYEDHHFASIDQARGKHKLPYPPLDHDRKKSIVAKLSSVVAVPATDDDKVEVFKRASSNFANMGAKTRKNTKRKQPKRV